MLFLFRANHHTPALLTLVLASAAQPLFGQDVPELSAVLVTTASRSERDITTTPAPVQLIDAADIQSMGAATLRDILELSTGLYVAPSGRNLQIRGLGHSDAVYLIDGRRIKGEFSNAYELERISATQIERIEILRGPASVLYGADALGGVINIITRRPRTGLEVSLDAQYGANSDGEGNRRVGAVDIRGGGEAFRYAVHASALRQRPYAEREATAVTVPQGGVQISPSAHPNGMIRNRLKDHYTVDVDYRDQAAVDTLAGDVEFSPAAALTLGLTFNYLQETREGDYVSGRYATSVLGGGGNFIQASNVPARQYDDNERLDLTARADWRPVDSLALSYRLHYSRYDKDRVVYALPWADLGYSSREASASSRNRSTLSHLIHDLTATWRPNTTHTVVAGLEHRSNKVDSTAYDADGRTYKSAFLQHEWQIAERFNAIYGARYDDVSVGGSQVSLQAGAVWKVVPLARLRFNYSQGFKAPDDRVLYVDQINPQGVPMLGAEVIAAANGKTSAHTLKPETSETYEVGLAGGGARWHYDLSVFHSEVKERIEQVREGSGSLSYNTFRNISAVRIQGIEAEGSWRIRHNLRARVGLTRLHAENLDTGERLLSTPHTLATVAVDFTPAQNWMLQAIVRHAGSQDFSGSTSTERADAYTLLNLKASYMPPANPKLEIYGGINNVLDEKVDTALGSDPGPYLYAGIRYHF